MIVITLEDIARILYWCCLICPIIGAGGVLVCQELQAKIKCHYIILLTLLTITVISACIGSDFYQSFVWRNDGLTRYLRLLIAVGACVSTILIHIWSPNSLLSASDDKRNIYSLAIFHILIALSLMAVAVNNFFIGLLFIVLLASLLMGACVFTYGATSIKVGWDYFRYILLFMVMSFIGALLLAVDPLDNAPFLAQFSSNILSLGLFLAVGIFPVSILHIELQKKLPIILGAISFFVVTVPLIATIIRLHQIPGYHPSEGILTSLIIISLLFLVFKEKDKHYQTGYISANFLVIVSLLASVFSYRVEGIYSACLLMLALVILAPIGYMVTKKNIDEVNMLQGWFSFALSGLPPIGIFFASSVLIAFLINHIPIVGYALLGILFIRSYFLLSYTQYPLFNLGIFNKSTSVFWILLLLQTLIIPWLVTGWLNHIAIDFTSNLNGASHE